VQKTLAFLHAAGGKGQLDFRMKMMYCEELPKQPFAVGGN